MDSISSEITKMQLKIAELEKQKKEEEEKTKKESVSYNLEVIDKLLSARKDHLARNNFSKSVPLARYYCQELVTHLEATYNLLHVMSNRLNELEKIVGKRKLENDSNVGCNAYGTQNPSNCKSCGNIL